MRCGIERGTWSPPALGSTLENGRNLPNESDRSFLDTWFALGERGLGRGFNL